MQVFIIKMEQGSALYMYFYKNNSYFADYWMFIIHTSKKIAQKG